MRGTYVTDITCFLNEKGEIASNAPAPARKLASFLALLIDAVTQEPLPNWGLSSIRCRKKGCHGLVAVACDGRGEEIRWECFECGHHGIISNWEGTNWDNQNTSVDDGF